MPASIEFRDVLRECATKKAYRETCVVATGGSELDPDVLEPLWRELRTDRGRYLLRGDLDRIFEEGKTVYGYYWRLSKLHESQRRNSGWNDVLP